MINNNEESKVFFNTLSFLWGELEEQDIFINTGSLKGYESSDVEKLIEMLKSCEKYDNAKHCNVTNGELRRNLIKRMENAMNGSRKLIARSIVKGLFSNEEKFDEELKRIDVARYLMGKGNIDQLGEVLDNMDQQYAIYFTNENPSHKEIGDLIRFNGHNCGKECNSSEDIAKEWISKGFVQMPPYEYPIVDSYNHIVINTKKVRESFLEN